jgi:Domain of unknown function (DUF4340)
MGKTTMRFATTLVLLVLTASGGGFWYWQAHRELAEQVADATSKDLQAILPASLTRIEVNDAQLNKVGTVWTLPGEWPTRTADVDEYVALLSGLQSRFAPLTFTKADDFGFDAERKPVVVKVSLRLEPQGEKTHTLTFGEPASSSNPFIRPTYVRIDDRAEVLRLEPGLLAKLRKTRDDFQRRQLFPAVARTKVSDGTRTMSGDGELPPAAVALLDASELNVASPDGTWTLKHAGPVEAKNKSSAPILTTAEKLAASWELTEPVADRADPDKLRGVLAAVPELWVEAFLPETDLQKTGLDVPERTVAVKFGDHELKVLIGKVSRVKETKPPAPPPANPFSPPPPPPPVIREEYRYAKLPNNSQVFELRTDKFPELFIKPADLRDAKLARFKSGDVKKLEVVAADRKLVFAREKDAGGDEKWRLLEPVQAAAEGPKVSELIDKLAELQARGADVIDTADLKAYGLVVGEPATTVTLTIAEEQPGSTPEAPKTTTTRTLNYRLGKQDTAKSKLYVQVPGQSRVNAVPDDLLKLVDRPVLAYRSRRILDVPTKQITQINVERPTDAYGLTQTDGVWSLAATTAKADPAKANALAGDLSRLEAVEYVNFAPKPEDLKTYGLDAPTLKAKLTLTDGSKTLVVGKPREGKPEVYAKLADAPEVFSMREAVKTTLDQPSLAFRPLQLWQSAGLTVKKIEVHRGTEDYSLNRDGMTWRISGPFDATAFVPGVQPLLDAASAPRAERFEVHTNDDLAKYGLDNPTMTLTATLVGERPEEPSGTKKLMIGKSVVEGQPARFARTDDIPGVFVLGPAATESIDKPALELLDRRLLSLDTRQINRIEGAGPTGEWSAKKDDGKWLIDSLSPPAAGDRSVIDGMAAAFADMRAQRYAAYGMQENAKYGLDKPSATVKVTVPAGDKPVTHSIALGNPVEGNPQARYARVDDNPAIAVLPVGASLELGRSMLELVDRGMMSFPAKDLIGIRRTINGQELSLDKKDGAWQVTNPLAAAADDPALTEMAERLSALRAVKVAALGVKDFKPFGLDPPTAMFTLVLQEADGKTRDMSIQLGTPTPDGRPVRVGTGDTVYLIADSAGDPLATRLTADPIKFRDRTLAKFTDADRVIVTRGDRSATFAKIDGRWKMTAPINADAESFDLDDVLLVASKLRADELVADGPADLKPFGLDKPEAELRFFQGDKEVLKLLASKKEADGRVAVKSADGGLVGKLDAGVSGRVLSEFRRRALWGNVDVAQADTLIINSGAGGTPLVMNKNDLGWQFADKPDQSAKPEAVSDVLATLAGLKAERYVVDQKGDLKLFGLDPAARVIIAKTRNGQTTTLHLGRYEGESQRLYATIPSGDGLIVVLSEADSAKLMKSVGEFGKK